MMGNCIVSCLMCTKWLSVAIIGQQCPGYCEVVVSGVDQWYGG